MSSLSTDSNAVDILREQCAGDVFSPSDATWSMPPGNPGTCCSTNATGGRRLPGEPARRRGRAAASRATPACASPCRAPATTRPRSASSATDTLLVRTSRMNRVHIDADHRIARVEAGALWQDVVPQASERGLLALHGSSPDVGVAGYSLGGGMGWLAARTGCSATR